MWLEIPTTTTERERAAIAAARAYRAHRDADPRLRRQPRTSTWNQRLRELRARLDAALDALEG